MSIYGCSIYFVLAFQFMFDKVHPMYNTPLKRKFQRLGDPLNSVIGLFFDSIPNKAVLALVGLAIVSIPGWAQTFSSVNSSNSALGGNLVVGDLKTTTITGATPNAAVTVQAFQNGNDLGTFTPTPGTTDQNGNFSVSGHATEGSVGNRTDIWSVGGTQIATNMYIIFDKPTSLSVVSVNASNPNTCGSSFIPTGGISYRTLTFGPSASIQYQITGADGSVSGAASLFEPQESINGGAVGDIGCDSGNCSAAGTNWQWSPPSAKFASQSGTFYDVPFSLCGNEAFTANNYETQAISIKIGNNSYQVRSQTWSAASQSSGHGTLSNSSGDVKYTQ